MSHNWLIITFTWFGSASLQYINNGETGADSIFNPFDANLPMPYAHFLNHQPTHDSEPYQGSEPYQFYRDEEQPPDLLRKRRAVEEEEARSRRMLPNLIEQHSEEIEGPIVLGFSGNIDENATDMLNLIDTNSIDKKNFSPWGGKRSKASVEHMWTWKRTSGGRGSSMPKRVRFSPWGGKRSGKMVYKPGSKGTKIIYSTSIPELTRVVSNFSPSGERFDLTGFQFIPSIDKRHPIKMMSMSAKLDDGTLRVALPFKTFLESLPKIFKPGHPYVDVQLKKDGKRKVKFSAWGGKRAPPIIGPIWSPAPSDIKESILKTLVMMKNDSENDDTTKAM